MGRKKKYIEMFGSFTEPFIYFLGRHLADLANCDWKIDQLKENQ